MSEAAFPSRKRDSQGVPAWRIGYHYYDDAQHYRQSDLQTWLPVLKRLGTAWLVLVAPSDRAIPEPFINGLKQNAIEPLLHFPITLGQQAHPAEYKTLFRAYASWGVRYVILFDRPNVRLAWPIQNWAQTDLVERFLDIFIPLAEAAQSAGLTPVFPPLEPGGDYWDTAFLRAALQSLQRRGKTALLNSLIIGAYAWADGHPLDWGAGGPERWPGARPYFTPADQQDQRSFYIFDWYQAVIQAAVGKPLPVILVGMGDRGVTQLQDGSSPSEREARHLERNLCIARRLQGDADVPYAAVSRHVLAGCFWLLAAEAGSPNVEQAWFQPGGVQKPIVAALEDWFTALPHGPTNREPGALEAAIENAAADDRFPIAHYLLLPEYDWGIADWHLEAIRPYIKRHQPTIGFSPVEAAMARRITVIGGENIFPEELLSSLRSAGSIVERFSGDGTEIATMLATR